MLSVLAASYGGWHGEASEAFWTWKFERNPHGQARIYVGDDGGRIAGCYILNPVMLRVGEATIRGAQAVDAAVSPDYRGRGVFTDLAQTALKEADDEGIKLIFAFPSQGAFGGQVRVGFKPQMVVPKAYRPLLGPARRRRFAGLTLGETSMFDARFDVFHKRGRDCEVSVRRDRDFLQWRYHEHPTQTYETLTCERDGEICGYAVLTVNASRKLASPGYVVDLQVSPESKSAALFLASSLASALTVAGCTRRRVMGTPERDGARGAEVSWLLFPICVHPTVAHAPDLRRPADRLRDRRQGAPRSAP